MPEWIGPALQSLLLAEAVTRGPGDGFGLENLQNIAGSRQSLLKKMRDCLISNTYCEDKTLCYLSILHKLISYSFLGEEARAVWYRSSRKNRDRPVTRGELQ